jgi:phosphotriesterase-related protein
MTSVSQHGYLTTVTGTVAAHDMGVTLPHEHLFNDLSSVVDHPYYDFSKVLVDREVEPSLMWALRQDPYCNKDNLLDKSVEAVSEEVRAFAALGGKTIVDATGTPAIGRDPGRLVEVAARTGLNVVMSTGPYLEKFEGERITVRTIDDQVEEILRDLTDGVEDTGVRAGMIGEIGVSPVFTPAERGALRAAGIAQTDAPTTALNIHMPGWERYGDDVLDVVLDEAGADPKKVSLAHSDPSGQDLEYQRRLLDRGVWLEFDMIGLDITFPKEGVSPSVPETVEAVARLVADGYGDQLLLSHDLFLKQMWTRNGGNGFAFVPQVFLGLLREHGVSDHQYRALVVDNPRRALTD